MKFCISMPAPVPSKPTAIMITGTVRIFLYAFFFMFSTNMIAAITDSTQSILSFQSVTVTSVNPAP